MAREEGGPPIAAPTNTGELTKSGSKRKRRSDEDKERGARIKRGPSVDVKHITDKKLKGRVKYTERVFLDAQQKTIKINDWLLPESAGGLEAEGIERTWNFAQRDIVAAVDTGAARKAFDLSLPDLGPYSLAYSRNGRYLVLGGRKGHLALMDWGQSRLVCEVQVAETTCDVTFLHNEMFFAAAQKKYVYIYDKRGLEVHCLRDHTGTAALAYLPHHFLLASVGEAGVLRYQDTSTGHMVASHKSKLGPCSLLRPNPHNGVLCLGHARGVVTMWTPNLTTPAVKMLCHRGPLTALAVDPLGQHMATAGADGQIKVWDIRMLKPLHSYFAYSPVTSLDISQRGLMAVGYGRRIQVWKDALRDKAQSPYMTHNLIGGVLEQLAFCPYEDVLAAGHSGGISSLLVPGAGEPNFDSLVANPFQSSKERQEQEVVQLLDKLQPDTIVLDPDTIGRVIKEPAEVQKQRRAEAEEANRQRLEEERQVNAGKTKMKGKNRPSKRHRKKQTNIVEERKTGVKERLQEEVARKKKEAAEKEKIKAAQADVPRALQRFYKK